MVASTIAMLISHNTMNKGGVLPWFTFINALPFKIWWQTSGASMYVLREEKADYVSLVSASGCYIGGPIYVNPGILALVYGMTLRSFKCHDPNLVLT